MAYIGTDFPTHFVGEVKPYTLDVSTNPAFKNADTISSVVLNIGVTAGTDGSAPSNFATATFTGTLVTSMGSTLRSGVKYRVEALATMASGEVLEVYSHVTCASAN